jgi:hypothetical protein
MSGTKIVILINMKAIQSASSVDRLTGEGGSRQWNTSHCMFISTSGDWGQASLSKQMNQTFKASMPDPSPDLRAVRLCDLGNVESEEYCQL